MEKVTLRGDIDSARLIKEEELLHNVVFIFFFIHITSFHKNGEEVLIQLLLSLNGLNKLALKCAWIRVVSLFPYPVKSPLS